ncbi:hypothetical protein EV361DRAFT_874038 [Lentinula raphanica]|nr:hypothetical protein EV361DRAFT_874038 [Lentinula raphanica]
MSDQRPPGRTINHGVLGGKRPRRRQRAFEDMHDDELVRTYYDAFSSDVPNAQYVRVDPIPTHSPNFTCSNADISGGMMSAVGGSQHISEDHHHHDTCNHIGVQNVYNYNYTIIDYKAAFIMCNIIGSSVQCHYAAVVPRPLVNTLGAGSQRSGLGSL